MKHAMIVALTAMTAMPIAAFAQNEASDNVEATRDALQRERSESPQDIRDNRPDLRRDMNSERRDGASQNRQIQQNRSAARPATRPLTRTQ